MFVVLVNCELAVMSFVTCEATELNLVTCERTGAYAAWKMTGLELSA